MTRSLSTLVVGGALASMAPTCDSGTGPSSTVLLDFAKPTGFVQVIAGSPVDLAWDSDDAAAASYADGSFEVRLVPHFGPPGADELVAYRGVPTSRAIRWPDTATGTLPPDYYGLRATLSGNGHQEILDGTDSQLVIVQGVLFRSPSIAGAVTADGTAPVTITYETETLGTIDVQLVLDPDLAVDGDEKVVDDHQWPGELRPASRAFTFSYVDAQQQAIAPGTYHVAAIVTDMASGTTYRDDGGTISW